MLLPLDNPNHLLSGKSFAEQCQLVVDAQDIYRLFGLTTSATNRDVIRVYKQLAAHFHPDHHPDHKELATQAMAKINAAREYLITTDTHSPSEDFDTFLSLAGQRILTTLAERRKNLPPTFDKAIPLSEATDNDLLCLVYWQRIENDAHNDGMNMHLNQDLIAEIKSRIENKSFGVLHQKLPPHGNTLLQLLARSKEVEFFTWLLNHAPEAELLINEQDNKGQTCLYHALINLNPTARVAMFNLIQQRIDLAKLQEDLDYMLRTAYVTKESLDLVEKHLPNTYFRDNATSIAKENPFFLKHIGRFVAPEEKHQLIKNALQKNSANYQYLAEEDRGNLEYIILAFLREQGRSQANVDALPLSHLPLSFIRAINIIWPDLKPTLAKTIRGYSIINNKNLYNEIKGSLAYKFCEVENMYTLLALNFILMLASAFVCVYLPPLAIPLALATTITLLAQAYSAYQWNATRLQVNKIRFFQDNQPVEEIQAYRCTHCSDRYELIGFVLYVLGNVPEVCLHTPSLRSYTEP